MVGSIMHYTNRMLGRRAAGALRAPVRNAQAFSPPVIDIPLQDAEYVVIDTELTGLKPKKDSIVSLGAIRMCGGRIMLGETFYRLVEPRTGLTAQSVVIHEIMPSEAAGSPGIEALLPEFLDFCGDATMVGHVVSIDLQFLNNEMKRLFGAPLQNRAADTYKLYQWIREREEDICSYHGGLAEDFDLFTLAKKYTIPVQRAHNALSDAFIAAQLFQRLLGQLPQRGITTLNELLRIGGP